MRSLSINSQKRKPKTLSKPSTEDGFRQWVWEDYKDEFNAFTDESFDSNNHLYTSVHYYNGVAGGVGSSVKVEDDNRLHFVVNPDTPLPIGKPEAYNYRAEIREHPSTVDYPTGTEQWWGIDYKFDENYKAGETQFIIWQTHGSFSTPSNPMTSLQIAPTDYQGSGSVNGELVVNNNTTTLNNMVKTGFVPKAGEKFKVVIKLIWGDDSTGYYKVWVNGKVVYDEQERTVYAAEPEGGYWKCGIYAWRFQTEADVIRYKSYGADDIHLSIGTLNVINYAPDNHYNGKDEQISYEKVDPARYEA